MDFPIDLSEETIKVMEEGTENHPDWAYIIQSDAERVGDHDESYYDLCGETE